MSATFGFLVDTYRTETEKTLSVWCMAGESELRTRPRAGDRRGRNLHEHMVHQCLSEDGWFVNMLGIKTSLPALPAHETRAAFVTHYAAAAAQRLTALAAREDVWWAAEVAFFDTRRSRAWIMVRRIAHTAHHRGQQTGLLRAHGAALHSTYGPTADTGGLGKDGADVIYPFADPADLLAGKPALDHLQPLPPPVARPVTERPDA